MKQQNINKHDQERHKGWKRLRRPQDDTETTKQYTEQEIQSLALNQRSGPGIIRPSTGDLNMPSDLAEAGYAQQTNDPPRVMLVIIILALIFIAIITYFVTQMPPKN